MMKTKHLFPIVLTALALGACSDDNVAPENGNGASWNSEGKGYVTLAINLPTEASSSRSNETTDDGLPVEYQVNDATLLLFNGNDEATATFHSAYDLKLGFNQSGSSTDQITSTAQITQQINQVEDGKVYALIVLNRNELFTVETNGGIKFDGEEGSFIGNFGTFREKAVDELNVFMGGEKNSFLMTNAPLASVQGGDVTTAPTDVKIYTLAQIDPDNIHETPEAAANDVAARIFVERAVGKVTLTSSASGTTTGGNRLEYVITGWLLDQTNTSSYLVRVAETNDNWWGYASEATSVSTDKYRFIGNTKVGSIFISNDTPNTGATGQAVYRTYWAKDPNYDANPDPALTKISTRDIKDNMSSNVPQYCFENTFNVKHQNQDETTRVIVKAVFNNRADFYTLNDDEKTLYKSEQDMQALFKAAFLSEPTIKAWLKDNATGDVTEGNVTVTTEVTKGIVTLKGITVNNLKESVSLPENFIQKTSVATGIVKYYQGGASYYPVLIKHFGDVSTPWNTWEQDPNKPASGNVYPGNAEQNYLGRYGVLRNNWYELNVTKIAHIGEPDIPEIDGPDDVIESYISVEIRILSWAKRTQDVEL